MQNKKISDRRYETLDLMRGLAASAVVIFHLNPIGWEFNPVPHGYLAVDFFFILSGFVMAHRYRDALLTTMRPDKFIALRVARLYPLAILGVVGGTLVMVCLWYLRPRYTEVLSHQMISTLLNMFLLPSVFTTSVTNFLMFPGNPALWSLFFEVAANIVWAWIGVRLSSRGLIAVLVVSGTLLAALAIRAHTANLGSAYPAFTAGCARVCFGFTAGLLIHQAHLHLSLPKIHAFRVFISAALILVVAAPFDKASAGVPWWDLASVILFCPALVMLGNGQGHRGAFGTFLGRISYPLYIIHYPVLTFFFFVGRAGSIKIDPVTTAVGAVVVSYALAWFTSEYYDRPVQEWLVRRGRRMLVLERRSTP